MASVPRPGRTLQQITGWLLLGITGFAMIPLLLLLLSAPGEPSLWLVLFGLVAIAVLGGRLAFG